MPAAVRERPPRNGPIIRYFMPLKTFSSGLEDSSESSSFLPSVVVAALAAWFDCGASAAVAAFDCRSGLACASAAIEKSVKSVRKIAVEIERAALVALLRRKSWPICRLSPWFCGRREQCPYGTPDGSCCKEPALFLKLRQHRLTSSASSSSPHRVLSSWRHPPLDSSDRATRVYP